MPDVKDGDLAELIEVLTDKEEEARTLRARLVEVESTLAIRTKERDLLRGFLERTMARLKLPPAAIPKIVLDEAERAEFNEELRLVTENAEKWKNAYAGLKVTALSAFKSYVGGLGLPVGP
jgi:hypothetical protein